MKLLLNFSHQEISNFHHYEYEWIDYFGMMTTPSSIFDNYDKYKTEIEKKFLEIGWDKENPIQIIWIPPFMIPNILKIDINNFLDKAKFIDGITPNNYQFWTLGLFLFHIKNKGQGESIILSPFELNIPYYGFNFL